MVNPLTHIQLDETTHKFGESAVITDAKALFDSATTVTSGLRLSERRTAIEICILRERLTASLSKVRWCNSLQQLADGLTKGAAKDALAHVLSRGVHLLRFDPSFVAAKKVPFETRNREEKELEKAAEELFDGQVFQVEGVREKEAQGLCRLAGCKKPGDVSSERHAYCSRRHFYLHQFRKGQSGDEWQKAAVCALTLLAAENLEMAEAASTNADEDNKFFNTLLVISIFAVIGVFSSVQAVRSVVIFVMDFSKNWYHRVYVRVVPNDMASENFHARCE